MTRFALLALSVLPALAVTGCPIYSDVCVSHSDCAPGYACDYVSGDCVPSSTYSGYTPPPSTDVPDRCNTPSDCRAGETCDRYLRCVPIRSSAGGQSAGGAAGESGAGG